MNAPLNLKGDVSSTQMLLQYFSKYIRTQLDYK